MPGAQVTAPFLLQAPLRSVLRDFDTIQKEQKEANTCTDKQDWWLRRFELDRRMKVGRKLLCGVYFGQGLGSRPTPQ